MFKKLAINTAHCATSIATLIYFNQLEKDPEPINTTHRATSIATSQVIADRIQYDTRINTAHSRNLDCNAGIGEG